MIGVVDHLETRGRFLRRWLAAATIISAAHVGGGAVALMSWSHDEPNAEPEGAMFIELAPMIMAPKEDPVDLPIGARSEDVAATPPTIETIKDTQPDEIPQVEESPAPDPEIAFEKKEPLKEIEEKEPQEALAASAPSVAAAPPPITAAAEAPKPAAPSQGSSRKPSSAHLSWQKALHLHLSKHKKYPPAARNKRIEGTVTVAFTIDRAGNVTSSRILKGSGSTLLDEAALGVLERSNPLPAPPDDYPSAALTMSLPIKFNIR